ncbi:7503_t:CDS:2 [Entrophospora sp. SA101]|nr:7503_t:CDS:2 [Entrophospora sp. SA101]
MWRSQFSDFSNKTNEHGAFFGFLRIFLKSVIGQATGRPMCYFCYNTSGLKSCTVTTEEFSGSLSTDYAVLLLTSQELIKNGSVSW